MYPKIYTEWAKQLLHDAYNVSGLDYANMRIVTTNHKVIAVPIARDYVLGGLEWRRINLEHYYDAINKEHHCFGYDFVTNTMFLYVQ